LELLKTDELAGVQCEFVAFRKMEMSSAYGGEKNASHACSASVRFAHKRLTALSSLRTVSVG